VDRYIFAGADPTAADSLPWSEPVSFAEVAGAVQTATVALVFVLVVATGAGFTIPPPAASGEYEPTVDLEESPPVQEAVGTSTAVLRDLGDSSLAVEPPITVDITVAEDGVEAVWQAAALFGHGDTESDAISALRMEIVAAYYDMEEARFDVLHGYLAELLHALDAHIRVVGQDAGSAV